MDEPRIDFISELLQEAEQADQAKKLQMDQLRADQLLTAVTVIEGQMGDVNELVDREIRLLEEYRSKELGRLDKQLSWLVFNLEGFARNSGQKTLRLPHGVLKLRKGRDKVAVVALDEFLAVGEKLRLVRSVPEQITPDIQAIVNHIKSTGEIPAGIEFISADIKFSYSTTKGQDDEQRETEG